MKSIKRFFTRFWQWYKEAAWIQVLLIVGVLVGVILGIRPVVSAISKLVEGNKKIVFYEKKEITYDQYIEKLNGQGAGKDSQFIVLFYSDTCSHCETIEGSMASFYNKDYKAQTLYTINTGDEDAFTDANKATLVEQYARVYNNQASEDRNPDYTTFPTDIPTPTFVVVRDKDPYKISLGISEAKGELYKDLLKLLEVE